MDAAFWAGAGIALLCAMAISLTIVWACGLKRTSLEYHLVVILVPLVCGSAAAQYLPPLLRRVLP